MISQGFHGLTRVSGRARVEIEMKRGDSRGAFTRVVEQLGEGVARRWQADLEKPLREVEGYREWQRGLKRLKMLALRSLRLTHYWASARMHGKASVARFALFTEGYSLPSNPFTGWLDATLEKGVLALKTAFSRLVAGMVVRWESPSTAPTPLIALPAVQIAAPNL